MEINRLIDTKKLLFSALESSYQIYSNQLSLCKEQFSEVNVHDLRVSIRRFMARFSMIKNIIPSLFESNYKQIIKPQLKIFNNLRDTQVQIIKVQCWVYQYPLLYKYYHHLINLEESYIDNLKNQINSFNNNWIIVLMTIFKDEMTKYFVHSNIEYCDLFKHVKSELQEVIDKFAAADRNNVQSIHKVRLSFKKFRYAMEIIQPIINLNQEESAKIKDFQTIMGDIQDNCVFHEKIKTFFQDCSENSIEEFKKIDEKILEERDFLIEQFFDNFNSINSFWKKEYDDLIDV